MATTIDGNTGISKVQDGTITSAKVVDGSLLSADSETLMQPLGVGQSWQVLTGSRAYGTTYTNTTGRSIQVNVGAVSAGTSLNLSANINGTGAFLIGTCALPSGTAVCCGTVIVPPGATYVITATSGTIQNWNELR